MNGLRYMNFAGFAVTKPNKVKVLEYLDELDPLCQKMGSSNTVVKTPEGKLIGYNTDGVGFYTALTEEAGVKVDQCVFFCFGGGGAGRACRRSYNNISSFIYIIIYILILFFFYIFILYF